MTPPLHIVTDADLKTAPAKTETVSERIRRLQAEARQLARDHVRALSAELVAVEETCAEIAEGGEVYPPGVRELCGRLVEEIEARVQTLEAIISRVM